MVTGAAANIVTYVRIVCGMIKCAYGEKTRIHHGDGTSKWEMLNNQKLNCDGFFIAVPYHLTLPIMLHEFRVWIECSSSFCTLIEWRMEPFVRGAWKNQIDSTLDRVCSIVMKKALEVNWVDRDLSFLFISDYVVALSALELNGEAREYQWRGEQRKIIIRHTHKLIQFS